jgi:putative transposase
MLRMTIDIDSSFAFALGLLLAIRLWTHCRTTATIPQAFHPRAKAQPIAARSALIHGNTKPPWVRETVLRLATEAPEAGCRTLANVFNRQHPETGVTVGKTYVHTIIQTYRLSIAVKNRELHGIASACPIRHVWAIDLTEHRLVANQTQSILGILDHGSRAVLTLASLREKSSIAILRLLLDAIEYYGKPKSIRTDNEAVFSAWVFAFALQWLGIRHQRTRPHCPWMNGRIERAWSTFKQLLRRFDIRSEVELQATLELLRETYHQQRPHQSLSGHTPAEAWDILKYRKPKRRNKAKTTRR